MRPSTHPPLACHWTPPESHRSPTRVPPESHRTPPDSTRVPPHSARLRWTLVKSGGTLAESDRTKGGRVKYCTNWGTTEVELQFIYAKGTEGHSMKLSHR